jgi:hypothetical protein
LREAGFHLTGVPTDQGGVWESVAGCTDSVQKFLQKRLSVSR